MRLLEVLPLVHSLEYRVRCEEGSLAATATVFLAYLETHPHPEEVITTTALELAQTLQSVRGDDARWFQKISHKIKKLAQKSK